MGRTHVKEFTSKEPREIIMLLNKMQVDCLFPLIIIGRLH